MNINYLLHVFSAISGKKLYAIIFCWSATVISSTSGILAKNCCIKVISSFSTIINCSNEPFYKKRKEKRLIFKEKNWKKIEKKKSSVVNAFLSWSFYFHFFFLLSIFLTHFTCSKADINDCNNSVSLCVRVCAFFFRSVYKKSYK